jgi:oxaloacetate decarboxylase gamma subunit
MTIAEMLEQSGVLAFLGMGIVFGFLIILVAAISFLGRLMSAGKTGNEVQAVTARPMADNAEVVAAISAAVNEYRKK